MKDTEKKLREIFNLKLPPTSSYILTNSYAKDAEAPIVFMHHTNTRPVIPFRSRVRNRNYCTLYIFLSNSHRFLTKNGIYSPSFGEALIFSEHEEFSCVISTTSKIDYFEINFLPDFFEKAPDSSLFKELFFARPSRAHNLIVPDAQNQKNMVQKLKELDHAIVSSYKHAKLLAYSYILQIMEILHYSCFSSDIIPRGNTGFSQEIYNIISYIHENYQTMSSINELCQAFNISYNYLERIFKEYLSCPPMTYITNLRIAYAKYLLEQNVPLTDVCFKAGFNNYTYFITKFKAVVGQTPAKFRKSLFSHNEPHN